MRKLLWISAMSLTAMVCLTACDDSSSAKGDDEKENAEGKSGDEKSLLPDISGEGCNFKKEDKVWSYVMNVGVEGIESKTYRFYTYNEKGSKDSVIAVTTGKEVSMACAYLGGNDKDVDESEDYKQTQITECHDGAMWNIDVMEMKYEDESRDEAFEEIMQHCRAVNDYDKDDIQETLDEAKKKAKDAANKGSEDEEEEEEDDNGGAIEDDDDDNNGTVEGNKDIEVTCDFKKSDDEWKFTANGGEMTISWESGKAISYTESDLLTAENCASAQEGFAALAEMMPGMTYSCEGSVLVTADSGTFGDMSRDEAYDTAMELCNQ